MYARIATFESDPSKIDEAIEMVRSEVDSDTPEGLEGAKMMMLVNRETGRGLGLTIFESEEAMRRGDEALNAMSPGASERRTVGRVLRGAGADGQLGVRLLGREHGCRTHLLRDLRVWVCRPAPPANARARSSEAQPLSSKPSAEREPTCRYSIGRASSRLG